MAQHRPPALVVVGDSISAAYGLPAGAGWVELLAARIKERGYPLRVVNASITEIISGRTGHGTRRQMSEATTPGCSA